MLLQEKDPLDLNFPFGLFLNSHHLQYELRKRRVEDIYSTLLGKYHRLQAFKKNHPITFYIYTFYWNFQNVVCSKNCVFCFFIVFEVGPKSLGHNFLNMVRFFSKLVSFRVRWECKSECKITDPSLGYYFTLQKRQQM